jgi:hypothetical protein
VLEPARIALLEGGAALILGTVAPDGEPHASRAWGLQVTGGGRRVRVLVGAEDGRTLGNVAGGGRVAITGADVRTLTSRQVKGRVEGTEPVTDADREISSRYCDVFFDAVTETDGTERALLERLRPDELVACEVLLDCAFDQSPGPGAGAPVGER